MMITDFRPSKISLQLDTKFNRWNSTGEAVSKSCDIKPAGVKRTYLSEITLPRPPKMPKTMYNSDEYLIRPKCNKVQTVCDDMVISLTNGYDKQFSGCSFTKEGESDEHSIPVGQNHTISIHETYQLGYLNTVDKNEEESNVFIFDFVDGLEVTYPVSITASDALPVDLPPLFMEPEYSDQLRALANDALNQLTQRIENWLVTCQESDDKITLWRHMNAHKASAELRCQVIRLLKILAPEFRHLRVDPQSPHVDKLFSLIINHLDTREASDFVVNVNTIQNFCPIVSLCADPDHCLHGLRRLVLTLLQKLLPELILPSSFDFERDLLSLIELICTSNLRAS